MGRAINTRKNFVVVGVRGLLKVNGFSSSCRQTARTKDALTYCMSNTSTWRNRYCQTLAHVCPLSTHDLLPGSTSNYGAMECFECPPGFSSEAGQHPCDPCAMGTYSAGNPH